MPATFPQLEEAVVARDTRKSLRQKRHICVLDPKQQGKSSRIFARFRPYCFVLCHEQMLVLESHIISFAFLINNGRAHWWVVPLCAHREDLLITKDKNLKTIRKKAIC
jgi:hypothetical protein